MQKILSAAPLRCRAGADFIYDSQHHEKSENWMGTVYSVPACTYIFYVFCRVLRPESLFKEIRRFYTYREQLGWKAVVLNLGGNVAGFMPFGFILPIVSRRGRRWYNTLLLSFFLSLGIETLQLIWKVGSFDVDDLFLNTVGGILGFVAYRGVQRIRIRRKLRGRKKS